MYSITWFDTRGVLRNICTPSEDVAKALFDSLYISRWRQHTPRMWHHPAKGEIVLVNRWRLVNHITSERYKAGIFQGVAGIFDSLHNTMHKPAGHYFGNAPIWPMLTDTARQWNAHAPSAPHIQTITEDEDYLR